MRKWLSLVVGVVTGISIVNSTRKHRKQLQAQESMMGFANYEAWGWFNRQFKCFTDKFSAVLALRDKIFVGRWYPRHPVDYLIFGLGRVCIEDFDEILHLCGNGFGIGAMQILRSMFERQVTAAYLSKFPDDVYAFVAYDSVHTRKMVEQLKEVYKNDPDVLNRIIPEEERKGVEERFQEVKKQFMKTKCPKCKTEELMPSWHKLNLPDMALAGAQPVLKDLIPYQSTRSIWMAHSTYKSIDARIVQREDGREIIYLTR